MSFEIYKDRAYCGTCGSILMDGAPSNNQEFAQLLGVEEQHVCPDVPVVGDRYQVVLDAVVKQVSEIGTAFVECKYYDQGSDRVLWVGWNRLKPAPND